MPKLLRVVTEEELKSAPRYHRIDLTSYLSMLDGVLKQGGAGGVITLGEHESQRTEKRRMSGAAKQRGVTLRWRRSEPRELRFALAPEGQPLPGARKRRA